MQTAERFDQALFERFAPGEGFSGANEVARVESALVKDRRLDVVVEEEGVVCSSGGDETPLHTSFGRRCRLRRLKEHLEHAEVDEAVAIADEVHAGGYLGAWFLEGWFNVGNVAKV